jgi:ABC-type nitrate/sulfonate/bicarbonate transport system substrate-binding protein
MRLKLTLYLASLLWIFAVSPLSAQLRKVRFSVSAASIAEVPFRIAQVKGFYREEGLEVEVIMIRGAVGAGSDRRLVDYTSASGSRSPPPCAIRWLVFIASEINSIIAQKEIRSVADLKGKNVGISSRGARRSLDAIDHSEERPGANKDVISLVVGGQKTRCSPFARDESPRRS